MDIQRYVNTLERSSGAAAGHGEFSTHASKMPLWKHVLFDISHVPASSHGTYTFTFSLLYSAQYSSSEPRNHHEWTRGTSSSARSLWTQRRPFGQECPPDAAEPQCNVTIIRRRYHQRLQQTKKQQSTSGSRYAASPTEGPRPTRVALVCAPFNRRRASWFA